MPASQPKTVKPKPAPANDNSLVPAKPAALTTHRQFIDASSNAVEMAFRAIGTILNQSPTDAMVAECYHVLNAAWLSHIEQLRKILREILVLRLKDTQQAELVLEDGGNKWRVRMSTPRAREPDEDLVVRLCEDKQIPPETLCTGDVAWRPSKLKIERALQAGVVTQEEIAGTYRTLSERLTVEKL